MICPTCGSQLNDDLKFCTQCGTPLADAAPATAYAPVEDNPTELFSEQPAAPAYDAAPVYGAAPAYDAAPAYSAAPSYDTAPSYGAAPVANDPGAGLGKTSKILGIVGIITSCCGFGSLLAIAALILGIIGGKKSKGAGFENASAKTGLILGIVGIAISVLVYVAYMIYYFVVYAAAASMYYW